MTPPRRAALLWLAVILLLSAAGCKQENTQVEITPEVVRVAITPAARYTGLAVSTCASGIQGADFEIQESYAGQAKADLLVRLGEPYPAATFAAQIAEEELTIVLNPANPAGSLTLEQVQALFSGRVKNWTAVGGVDAPVQVWSLLPADETREVFVQIVLQNGLIVTTAQLAPTPELMAETIASNPNAIGFLPKSWITSDLTAILPGVSMPVLVVSDQEPTGAARQLVICLQSAAGQEMLQAFFPN